MNILTVSGLNAYIRSIFDGDGHLMNVFLSGEISNCVIHKKSGHVYFSVKDACSVVKCIMFAGCARNLRFVPADGQSVILRGRVSVYEATGQYQIYVEDMYPEGVGELSFAFEKIKNTLSKEGLFDPQHKQPIPAYPNRVGVITSEEGAAFQDICNIIQRRFPVCEVVLCPVFVQGQQARGQIIKAIKLFNEKGDVDVIIIGRGGGSVEDLWSFNDEQVAREVFKSKIPIVSAVGHETDFTICDYVADLRAPTPSAAAELVVPDVKDVKATITLAKENMNRSLLFLISEMRTKLMSIEKVANMFSPVSVLQGEKLRLDKVAIKLMCVCTDIVNKNKGHLAELVTKLDSLSPMKVLTRGYVVVRKANKLIKSMSDVHKGDLITVKLADGEFDCCVTTDNMKKGALSGAERSRL